MPCYFLYGFLYNAWDHNFRSSSQNHTGGGARGTASPHLSFRCLYIQSLPMRRKICKSVSFLYYFLLFLFLFVFIFIYTEAEEMFLAFFGARSNPSILGAVILHPRGASLLLFPPGRRLWPDLHGELHGDRVKLLIRSFFSS